LLAGGVEYGLDQYLVYFERLGEMVRNLPWDDAGQQHCAEFAMTCADLAIAEPVD
jgi:hypothetical protein